MVRRTVIVAKENGYFGHSGGVGARSLAVKDRSTRSRRPGNNPNAPGVAFNADRFRRFATEKAWVPSKREESGDASCVAVASHLAISGESEGMRLYGLCPPRPSQILAGAGELDSPPE